MAEAIASLISDSESAVVSTGYVVIYAPKRGSRKRFPENCVTPCASEAEARITARPDQNRYAAVASGPSRSSEGFHLFYLVRWLD
ncbi:MAG: hypothetical protein B7Y41_04850 [Hydrogenophilales bacterium 28-61-23]|nr:MAG: hypothetical protein B7Y41_04850 [Hydrogenophilales bacterium 28-61-23]